MLLDARADVKKAGGKYETADSSKLLYVLRRPFSAMTEEVGSRTGREMALQLIESTSSNRAAYSLGGWMGIRSDSSVPSI
jgi:hypothetical protein